MAEFSNADAAWASAAVRALLARCFRSAAATFERHAREIGRWAR